MATGTVVLGPCPALWRELLHALLAPAFDVIDAGEGPDRAIAIPERLDTELLAVVLVGGTSTAALSESSRVLVPVVQVDVGGRCATRYLRGSQVRTAQDLSASGLRELIRGC